MVGLSKASRPSLTMAYLSITLAATCVVLSLVALVGNWWYGQINPKMFGGAFKGTGSLSLWGFATSSDFFGYKLPSTFMRVDADSCGNIRPVDGEDVCGKLNAIRGLVISSAGFMGLALLSSIFALFALGGCCRCKYRGRSWDMSLLVTAFLTAMSLFCMVCALAVGSSTDTEHMMTEFGGMGAAFYCAVAQVVVGFVTVNVSCVGGCCVTGKAAARQHQTMESEGSIEGSNEGSNV
eukprot:symbB.v1.2.008179.t1/scaffold512.1/size193505/20